MVPSGAESTLVIERLGVFPCGETLILQRRLVELLEPASRPVGDRILAIKSGADPCESRR